MKFILLFCLLLIGCIQEPQTNEDKINLYSLPLNSKNIEKIDRYWIKFELHEEDGTVYKLLLRKVGSTTTFTTLETIKPESSFTKEIKIPNINQNRNSTEFEEQIQKYTVEDYLK